MSYQNRPRFMGNESFQGRFPQIQFNVNNQNAPMSPPPSMTRNISSISRFFGPPFPNTPPPFVASKFPGLVERDTFPENSPVIRAHPPVCMPGRQIVRQPYRTINVRLPPPPFPNQNGPFGHGERFFVPWNERPPPDPPVYNNGNRTVLQFGRPELGAGASFSGERKETQQNKKADHSKVNRKPWMSQTIFEALSAKQRLFLQAKNINTEEAWSEFRTARNKLHSLIKDAKTNYVHMHSSMRKEECAKFVPASFSCDNCDRAFAGESYLRKHIQEHVKCNLEGCQFEAHPKVIALHRKMQHDTGYAKTIMKLNNTEEIEKWRLERKRRFPTAENIKKREAEQVEKTARGEVIETGYFGKFKKPRLERDESSGNCRTFRRSRNIKEPMNYKHKDRRRSYKRHQPHTSEERQQQRVNKSIARDVDPESDDDSHIQLTPFQGMLPDMPSILSGICNPPEVSVLPEPHDGSKDMKNVTSEAKKDTFCEVSSNTCYSQLDDDTNGEKDVNNTTLAQPLSVTVPVVQREQACLSQESDNHLNSFESIQLQSDVSHRIDNDSDGEAPTVIPFSQAASTENFSPVDGSGINEENSDTIQKSAVPDKRTKPAVPVQNLQNGIPSTRHSNFRRKSTFLEKLLAKEISHERNVLLQCIRHAVNNEFFGVATD